MHLNHETVLLYALNHKLDPSRRDAAQSNDRMTSLSYRHERRKTRTQFHRLILALDTRTFSKDFVEIGFRLDVESFRSCYHE